MPASNNARRCPARSSSFGPFAQAACCVGAEWVKRSRFDGAHPGASVPTSARIGLPEVEGKNPYVDLIVSCTSSPTNSDFKLSDRPTVAFCVTCVMIPLLVVLCHILRLVLCYISVDSFQSGGCPFAD